MLRIFDRPTRLCDGISRREWLRIGGLGLTGLTLGGLAGARQAQAASDAQPGSFGRAKNCIVLFFLGGPPQHETWDPKPEAPPEVRGDLKPIESRVPGMLVGELMPLTARHTDKIAVLRAMSTYDNAHSSSGYWMLTGVPHQPTNSENSKLGAPNNHPCFGAMVQHLRGTTEGLPAAITIPEHIWNTGGIVWPGQDAGWLGRRADPWLLMCDPNAADFQVPGVSLPVELPDNRFDGRRTLLGAVDARLAALDGSGTLERWDHLNQQAVDTIRSSEARRAFRIDDEPAAVRERYGRHRFGQSVLLARRLIEAGVSLVQVNWTRSPDDKDVNPVWDTHTENAARLKSALMPPMDQAYSALLEDLSARGLLDETLVVWMGEFGRSPRINPLAGRDHWGSVFSVALAGGGVAGGQVWGSSDPIGGFPLTGRVEPQDLHATIYHALGVGLDSEIRDHLGRPIPLTRGRVLGEIL